jgi:LPXTG-site transpeptidase (sortase) family protein
MDKSQIMLLISIFVLVILLIVISCFKVIYVQSEKQELDRANIIINNEVDDIKTNEVDNEIDNVYNTNYEEQYDFIEENTDIEVEDNVVDVDQEDIDLNQEMQEEIVEEENVYEIEEIDGVEYIENYEVSGYLNIPKIGINIPILNLSEVEALRISAAIHYGPGLNEVGNTTIIGHNYEGMYFEKLHELENGDELIVTDQNKQEVIYEVYDKQKAEFDDTAHLLRLTNGEKEITFSIIHPEEGVQSRLIILTREKK